MAPAWEAQELQQEAEAVPRSNPTDEVPFKSKVTVVGSGNWGSVASKLIASNTLRLTSFHCLFLI